jgi:Cu/Ag efflux protein CusF
MNNEKKKSFSIKEQHPNRTHIITKFWITSALIIGILVTPLSQSAFAHGNETHVIGTVKNVTDHSVTVTTMDGKTQEVRITDATLFERSGHSATLRDLSVGDRVVIHAVTKNGNLEAHTVKIGSSPKGKP